MSSPSALRRACKLTLETLETRCLLSASLVRDIMPGFDSSNIVSPVGFNDRLYFGARDGVSAHQTSAFWSSDGTEEGTSIVRNFNTTQIGSIRTGDFIYFTTRWLIPGGPNTEVNVYRSDGADPTLVYSARGLGTQTNINNLTVAGDRCYFVSRLFVSLPNNYVVNLFEVTSQGRRTIVESSSSQFGVINLAPTSQGLFFTTNFRPDAGFEVYYDTPDTGASLLRDILPGTNSSRPSDLTVINDVLYFVADDGEHGRELRRSDGTAEGTYLLKDINPGPDWAFGESIGFLTDIGGTLYFSADDGQNGVELWKSDGTEEGTVLVADISPGAENSWVAQFVEYNGLIVFVALTADYGYELWASDGTPEGTYAIADINPGQASSFPDKPVVHNGLLYFSAEEGAFGRELWASDATAKGTFLAADVRPGAAGSDPLQLTSTGGILYFTADDWLRGVELWKLDEGSSPRPGGSDWPALVAALMGRSETARPVVSSVLAPAPVGDERAEPDLEECMARRPVHFQEVFATLYHMGIDPATTHLIDPTGRPQHLVQQSMIRELIG